MMKILKEPLLHFLLLASLLFAFNQLFSTVKKPRIVVDRQTVAFLIAAREELEMRELDSTERKQLIATYVEDEMLYDEAYKRGLDKADSRMRQRLIKKMRRLLSGDIGEPTEAQLRSYYDLHRQDFVRPASISVEHVYFLDKTPPPAGVLEQLRAGADYKMVGDSRLGKVMPGLTAKVLTARFGKEGADRMLAIDDKRWHGPFESRQGQHFVRVYERSAAHQMGFEEMRPFLADQWRAAQARLAVERELQRIAQGYDVVIKGPVADADADADADASDGASRDGCDGGSVDGPGR